VTRKVLERNAVLLSSILVAAGCGPSTACRVREDYGRVSGSYRIHRIAADGRLISIAATGHGESGHVAFTYDGHGRLVRRERTWSQETYRAPHPSPLDRIAGSSKSVVEWDYGADGKKVRARRDDGAVETYRWNGDNLVGIQRRGSDSYDWEMRWEGSNLLEARHIANGRASMIFAYEYDARGRRVRETLTADFLAQNRWWSYEYDPSGALVVRKLVIDGVESLYGSDVIERDDRGQITRISKEGITTTFEWDQRGRLIRTQRRDDPAQTFQYEDDCTSEMTKDVMADPLASVWNPVETM
jgi:YD repeat-containing protein